MRRKLTTLTLVGGLALTGCSSSTSISVDPEAASYEVLKISTGVSEETKLVAYLYAEALNQAGYRTELVDTGQSREDYLTQLEDGLTLDKSSRGRADTLDIVPDFSGELLMYLTDDGAYSVAYLEQQASASATPEASQSPEVTASPLASPSPYETSLKVQGLNSADIHSSLDRLMPEGIEVLDSSKADPKHALAVTRPFAAPEGISEIGDLAEICAESTFAMSQNSEDSDYASQHLAKTYGCEPGTIENQSDPDTRIQELITGKVQVADVRATSPGVSDNDLLVLSDPSNLFISQNITPLIRAEEVPQGARSALDTVSGKLDDEQLAKLLRLTSGDDGITYENVAKYWLDQAQE